MKKLLITVTVVLALKADAQFQRSYGIQTNETGQSVQATNDKGYIVAGYTRNPYIGLEDATLLKTDNNGNPLWIKAYGGERFDFFNSVRDVIKEIISPVPQARNQNAVRKVPDYLAAGQTQSFGFGNNDVYLVGTDFNGVPYFSTVYGGQDSDIGHCVQVVRDSVYGYGYVIVGETKSFPHLLPGNNVYVILTDVVGNLIRSVVIGTKGDDQGFWIEQTKDGGYIIAGTTTYPCSPTLSPTAAPVNKEIYAIRLKADLSVVWSRIIGGGYLKDDVANCVRENPNGTFTFTGVTSSFGVGTSGDVFLLNLDAAGNFIWMKTYGNKGFEEGKCLIPALNTATLPGYVVSGYTNSTVSATFPNYDAQLFQTDYFGNLMWTKRYGLKGQDYGVEIDHSLVPGFVFTGRESSFGAGGYDVYLVETDVNGKTGSGCEKDTIQKVTNVYPCITKNAQYKYVDPYLTIESKYLDIKYEENKCSNFSPHLAGALDSKMNGRANSITAGIHIVPNPASTSVSISFGEHYIGGTIRIMDYQGKLVMEEQVGQQQVAVKVENLPSGIYVVRVVNGKGESETAKFIKQ